MAGTKLPLIGLNNKQESFRLSAMNLESLADALIALRCGTHSLGLVYEFLLKTYGDPKRARGDFLRFLSGELPARLLAEAQFWVAEEQGELSFTEADGDGTGTVRGGDPISALEAQSQTSHASW